MGLATASANRLVLPQQNFYQQQPGFSSCRLADLGYTAGKCRRSINFAVVSLSTEKDSYFSDTFFVSTL